MALNSTHPLYDQHVEDWTLMRDCQSGERVIKKKGEIYLPSTPGQRLDGLKVGQEGRASYEAYKERAVFHDYVSEAVEAYIGMLHQNPATFELPDGMDDFLTSCSSNGEDIQTFLRRINEQQLLTGRLGLLVDLPENPDPTKPLPYITMYTAEMIRNWDDSSADGKDVNSLNLVVLDESIEERDNEFNWVRREKYRVLSIGAPEDVDPAKRGVYAQGLFQLGNGSGFDPNAMMTPMLRGKTLDKIPFTFINTKDTIAAPDNPPMLGLGRLSITIYRAEADYRNQLFLQGQDTLVIIGGIQQRTSLPSDDAVRTGAGARIDVDINGDAKYIGVSATGLPEVRSALEADKARAEKKAGSIATKTSGQVESGETLSTRLGAQTATLKQIALSGAAGIEKSLKDIAVWMGKDPDKVKVTPNLEWTQVPTNTKELVDLVTVRSLGGPISFQSIHEVMVDRGLSKKTFDEEMELIEEEDALSAKNNEKLGLDPTGQVIPPPEDQNNPGNGPPAGGNGGAGA